MVVRPLSALAMPSSYMVRMPSRTAARCSSMASARLRIRRRTSSLTTRISVRLLRPK